jgi:hypothetical protein
MLKLITTQVINIPAAIVSIFNEFSKFPPYFSYPSTHFLQGKAPDKAHSSIEEQTLSSPLFTGKWSQKYEL